MVSTTQTVIDAVFNPVLGWLLNLHPLLALFIVAAVLGLLSTLLQKFLTDQAKMKRLKDDTKKLQKQAKEKRSDPQAAMKIQQKMLPMQMELMKESFKPLLVTLLPFLLVFFWLSHHFAFYPIVPNEPFTVTANFVENVAGNATLTAEGLTIDEPVQEVQDQTAQWTLQGPEGSYFLSLDFAGGTFTREVLITTERMYEPPVEDLKGTVEEFNVDNRKLIPIGGFDLFGWTPGWIFYYILFSIPLSLGFKKLLKVV